MLPLPRRARVISASAIALLAAVATILGNVDKIAASVGGWLRPWLQSQAEIEVVLDTKTPKSITVALVDKDRVIDTQVLQGARAGQFLAPAHSRYTLIWQGPATKPERADDILAPPGRTRWRLVAAGGADGQEVLSLRPVGTEDGPTTSPPSAGILASVVAAQSSRDPSARPPGSGLVPELDRAVFIVGLFESGTTDCHRAVTVQSFGIGVGCLGIGIPGWLSDVLLRLRDRKPDALRRAFGDDEPFIISLLEGSDILRRLRAGLETPERRDSIAAGFSRLVETIEFRQIFHAQIVDAYGDALKSARLLGLESERGTLFVFDRTINQGAGIVARLHGMVEADPAGFSALDEAGRIRRFGDALKARVPSVMRSYTARRIDAIQGGRATVRGITYDLNALGISDQPSGSAPIAP